MKYYSGDVYSGEWRGNKQHGKGTFEYANGDVLKSIGEWKEGKKDGVFEDIVRVTITQRKKVFYEDDEAKTKVESDIETDTEDTPSPSNKRQKVDHA